MHPTLSTHSKNGVSLVGMHLWLETALIRYVWETVLWFQLRRIKVLKPRAVRYNLYAAYPT